MCISQSATKIVLLIFSIAITVAFLFDVITGRIILETKDFLAPVMLVLGFYFAYKGDSNQPYAGK